MALYIWIIGVFSLGLLLVLFTLKILDKEFSFNVKQQLHMTSSKLKMSVNQNSLVWKFGEEEPNVVGRLRPRITKRNNHVTVKFGGQVVDWQFKD